MDEDAGKPEKSSGDTDEARSEMARRVMEEYVAELREWLKKLRRMLN
jgi:hypothetical protein